MPNVSQGWPSKEDDDDDRHEHGRADQALAHAEANGVSVNQRAAAHVWVGRPLSAARLDRNRPSASYGRSDA